MRPNSSATSGQTSSTPLGTDVIRLTIGGRTTNSWGMSISAKGTMRSQRFGGDAAGAIVSATPTIGSFTVTKSSVDLGAPAEFTAVAGDPGSGTETVRAEVVATSTAGVWHSTDAGKSFTSVWPAAITHAMGAIAVFEFL